MRICIFGDSITWGVVDPEGGGWVTRLRSWCEKNLDDVSVYNLGISGDATTDLLKRLTPECEARQPDVIVFAVGINGSAFLKADREKRVTAEDQFRDNLCRLAKEAHRFSDRIVFVGFTNIDERRTMPLAGSTTGKCYTRDAAEKYDAIVHEVAVHEKCLFVPTFDLLDNEDLFDGLHPKTRGHEKLFETILRTLKQHVFQTA